MGAGVGKSGSPAPKPTMSSPAAFFAFAFASTARVADSAMLPIRCETRCAGRCVDGEWLMTHIVPGPGKAVVSWGPLTDALHWSIWGPTPLLRRARRQPAREPRGV